MGPPEKTHLSDKEKSPSNRNIGCNVMRKQTFFKKYTTKNLQLSLNGKSLPCADLMSGAA